MILRSLLFFLGWSGCSALLFKPSGGRSLWDQEGLIVNGTWYMWYDNNYCPDGKRGAGISNYGLATSTDGVHWTDDGISMTPWSVNPCSDPKMNTTIPVAGIGSGSAWESPTQKGVYVINYSQGVKDAPWGQAIRFSTSTDLKAWTPATEIPLFHEEGKHYTKGRWDTIMQFTDAHGVMHGWWTATPLCTPPKGTPEPCAGPAFGYGTSTDGLHWTPQPAAILDFRGLPASTQTEVGGVVQMPNGKWYGQACAIEWGHVDNLGGCFAMVADKPGGPFVLQQKNFAFLGYGASDGIPAYFSRFYLGPDGAVLANYQQTGSYGTYLAPLKAAVVDPADGVTMRWKWFKGNDALRGNSVPGIRVATNGTVSPTCNIVNGTIIEGTMAWDDQSWMSFGTGRTKMVLSKGTLELHGLGAAKPPTSRQGIDAAAMQPSRTLDIVAADTVLWRLIIRAGAFEIYFAGPKDRSAYYFGVAYRTHNAVGDLALGGGFAKNPEKLSAWTMSLSA